MLHRKRQSQFGPNQCTASSRLRALPVPLAARCTSTLHTGDAATQPSVETVD
jgi:hypothetical protein